MKVVHVNTYDTGGAFVAAYRIHLQMLQQGIDSKFLVLHRDTRKDVTEYMGFRRSPITKAKESIKYRFIRIMYLIVGLITRKKKGYTSLPFSPYDISSLEIIRDADVINLHFIANFVSYSSLSKIKPAVLWTLHDESAFSGLFHYSYDIQDSLFNRLIRKYKQERIKEINFICPSTWICKQLSKSTEGVKLKSVIIHNGISLKHPILQVENGSPKIGYVSGDLSDVRKGADLFFKMSERMANIDTPFELLVVGENKPLHASQNKKIRYLGFLDDHQLDAFYQQLDLLVFTSRADNLPNVLLEAMSCNTAVICFDVGGVDDIVTSEVEGFLIPPFDEDSFISKVKYLLKDQPLLKTMGANAAKKVGQMFEISCQSSKYLTHYQDTIT